MQDDLTSLKDDMTAFIEGHGMKRFFGYVTDDMPCVMWEEAADPDGWKAFVELAKAAGAPFLTMNDVVLEREEVDDLVERLSSGSYPDEDDVEEARWLRACVGKMGFVQIGWPHQGAMFLYEKSTPWYDKYMRLLDIAEEFGGFVIDEADQDDER
jgi:hypothetical protein